MGQAEKDRIEGIIVRKQRERDAVEIKIDRCIKDLNYYSFPSDGIESIECDKVLQAARELKELYDRWEELGKEVEKLRAEV